MYIINVQVINCVAGSWQVNHAVIIYGPFVVIAKSSSLLYCALNQCSTNSWCLSVPYLSLLGLVGSNAWVTWEEINSTKSVSWKHVSFHSVTISQHVQYWWEPKPSMASPRGSILFNYESCLVNPSFAKTSWMWHTSVLNVLENGVIQRMTTTLREFAARPQCCVKTRAKQKFSSMLLVPNTYNWLSVKPAVAKVGFTCLYWRQYQWCCTAD